MKLAVIGRKQIGNSQMRKHREQSGTCCWMKAPSKHFFPKKWKCMHRENGLIHCVTLPCLPHAVSCCYQKGKKWKPFIRRRKSSYSCATHQKDMLQPVQLGKQWINHFLSFLVVGEEKEENKNFRCVRACDFDWEKSRPNRGVFVPRKCRIRVDDCHNQRFHQSKNFFPVPSKKWKVALWARQKFEEKWMKTYPIFLWRC